MRRLNARFAQARQLDLVPDWTQQLKRRKLMLVANSTTQPGWPAQCMNWTLSKGWQNNVKQLPYRKPGRPMTRWDDDCRFTSNLDAKLARFVVSFPYVCSSCGKPPFPVSDMDHRPTRTSAKQKDVQLFIITNIHGFFVSGEQKPTEAQHQLTP